MQFIKFIIMVVAFAVMAASGFLLTDKYIIPVLFPPDTGPDIREKEILHKLGETGIVAAGRKSIFFPEEGNKKSSSNCNERPGIVTRDNVNLRTGGSLNAQSIARLPIDTQVLIIGYRGGWFNVLLKDGREGWIRNDCMRPMRDEEAIEKDFDPSLFSLKTVETHLQSQSTEQHANRKEDIRKNRQPAGHR